eukprot:Phypoly_transcript_24148.p1 GENE.Phypoly_transcript_24148~~Phypoly_transcript_24148.p1  ORF type:complete len:109 (+),score=19.02 Phypoly_transcript_24148:24-329(+)
MDPHNTGELSATNFYDNINILDEFIPKKEREAISALLSVTIKPRGGARKLVLPTWGIEKRESRPEWKAIYDAASSFVKHMKPQQRDLRTEIGFLSGEMTTN